MEVLEFMLKDEVADKIYSTLNNGDYKYYSLASIVRLTNYTDQQVKKVLQMDTRFRLSSFRTKTGEATYTLSSNKKSLAEKLRDVAESAYIHFDPNRE